MSLSRILSKANTLLIVVVFCAGVVGTAGCYQRQLAPEIEYSESKVKRINQEIDQMEWE